MKVDIPALQKVLKALPPNMRGYVIGTIFAGGLGYFKYQQDVGTLRHENELLRQQVAQLEKRANREFKVIDKKFDDLGKDFKDLGKNFKDLEKRFKEDLDRKFDLLQRENAVLRDKFYKLSLGVQLRTELAKVTQQVKDVQQSDGIIVGRVKDFLSSLRTARTSLEAEEIIEKFSDDPQEPIGEDGEKTN